MRVGACGCEERGEERSDSVDVLRCVLCGTWSMGWFYWVGEACLNSTQTKGGEFRTLLGVFDVVYLSQFFLDLT